MQPYLYPVLYKLSQKTKNKNETKQRYNQLLIYKDTAMNATTYLSTPNIHKIILDNCQILKKMIFWLN